MVLLIGPDECKCLKCTSTKCSHIQNWIKWKGGSNDEVPDQDPLYWTSVADPVENDRQYEGWVISDTPIPANMENIIKWRGFADVSNLHNMDLPWSTITPAESHRCQCGFEFNLQAPLLHCRVMVYGTNSATTFDAPCYPCTSDRCDKKLEFDNVNLGLIRLTREVIMDIVCVSLIYKDIIVGGFAMSRIHNIMTEQHRSLGLPFMGRETFRKCSLVILKRWYLLYLIPNSELYILRRFDVDLDASFGCCHCGSLVSSPVLIMLLVRQKIVVYMYIIGWM